MPEQLAEVVQFLDGPFWRANSQAGGQTRTVALIDELP